jgi:hypothetical protein
MPHAWFIDRQASDVALDTTLSPERKLQYFGIPIPWRSVCAALLAENVHGPVFDYWEKTYGQRKPKG